MTAQDSHPPPRLLQPALKSTASPKNTDLSAITTTTSSSSSSSTTSTSITTAAAAASTTSTSISSAAAPSRLQSHGRSGAPKQDGARTDSASQRNTLALIRRVLAPDKSHATDPRGSPRPVEELLPPLTSSNEVDIQLYAIIAIIVKDYVNSWYSKITTDHTFVDEVVQIIAHCSRALEQRLRKVNIEELFLDEVPALLLSHIQGQAYRIAHRPSAVAANGRLRPRQIYHALNPHPALSPTPDPDDEKTGTRQQENEATYRHLLVQSALAILLPTEDLENAGLRTLVDDIMADLILGQVVAERVSEGWFVHETISKLVAIIKTRVEPKTTGEEIQNDARNRLEKFGLLSSKVDDESRHSSTTHQSHPSLFWRLMQYAYLAFLFFRFVVAGIAHARRLPPRSPVTKIHQSSLSSLPPPPPPRGVPLGPAADPQPSPPRDESPRPVLTYRILATISTFLDLATRMPWLAGALAFGQHLLTAGPGRLGAANSLCDKFLFHTLHERVLPASLLPSLLLDVRTTLFPNNSLGPPPAPGPQTSEELERVRARAARDLLGLVPGPVAAVFFASPDPDRWRCQVETDMLDLFSDPYLNRHLIYAALELVLVRLLPELAEETWSDLMKERGVI